MGQDRAISRTRSAALARALALYMATATLAAPAASAESPAPPVVARLIDVPARLANGTAGTPVRLPSRTPDDYRDIIAGKFGVAVDLSAQLFLPPSAGAKGVRLPAVIIVPGSGGVDAQHFIHATTLTSAGMAVLLIDPFGGRNIGNTSENQGQLSFAASTYDVFAAVKYLRARPEIDPQRIGATGGSRGGTAVMMAAARPLARAAIGDGPGLKAVVAGYPWCGVQFHDPRLSHGAGLLILQGDRDDWTSFLQCQGAAHGLEAAGEDARMMLFPGVLHAFDRTDIPVTEIPEAVTSTIYPTIYLDDRGHYFDFRTGRVDLNLNGKNFADYAVKGGFHHKGVHIGAKGTEAVEYSREMLDFFKARLRK